MGWTYTHKHSSLSMKDFFKEEFGFANDRRAVRLLDCAVVNLREAYLAFEDLDKATGKREVFAMVCLLDYKPNDYYNIGYKDMEESEGPYYYNCPERILKLLTPTTNEYALRWRQKCWERIERRKSMSRLTQVSKPGGYISPASAVNRTAHPSFSRSRASLSRSLG